MRMSVRFVATAAVTGLLGLGLLGATTRLVAQQGAVPAAMAAKFDAAIKAWADGELHRGVSAAVILEDGREWVGVAGVSGAGQPLKPEDLIWIASITKTMTGAVIMQLAQEGKLGLDDPASKWLSGIPNLDPAITLRQLLNHTAGLANYTANPDLSAAVRADSTHLFTAEELAQFTGPPAFSPGERTQYTNTAFLLLGLVAEKVTGKPMTELWSTRLWKPLGMTEIFLPGYQKAPGPVAQAWRGRQSQTEVAPLQEMSVISTGSYAWGLFSNARTIAHWGRALFAGNVIGPDMHEQMLHFVPAAGNIPGESGTGLGIRQYGYLGREQVGHSGGSPLGSSLLLYDRETGITVVVIMNQGGNAQHFALAPSLLEIASAGSAANGG